MSIHQCFAGAFFCAANFPRRLAVNEEKRMTVWLELQNGTRKIYKNVNRIVERSGQLEIRTGIGLAERMLAAYEKTDIKHLGNLTTLPHPLHKTVSD